MSDDPKPTELDARIDAVLREAVRGAGPADLRRRVMAELAAVEPPSSPGWFAGRLVPVFGVAVGLVVAAGLLILAWPGGTPSRTTAGVSTPTPVPVGSPSAAVYAPAPLGEQPDSREQAPVMAAAVSRPVRSRRPRVSDPPEWRASQLEALTLEQITVPAIAWDDHPRPAELVLGDLDLPPVEVETSQPLTDQ